MQARAIAKHVGMSPRKVRMVVDLIRGKRVEEAAAVLRFAPQSASEPVLSVSTFIFELLPSRMIEPSPNCLVMEESASSQCRARALSIRRNTGSIWSDVTAMASTSRRSSSSAPTSSSRFALPNWTRTAERTKRIAWARTKR